MYTVIIHARGSDLADLIGLVGTMKEARLVSASLQEQQQPEAVVAKKRRGPAKRAKAEATDGDDPRLVFNIRPTGAKKVDDDDETKDADEDMVVVRSPLKNKNKIPFPFLPSSCVRSLTPIPHPPPFLLPF